MGLKSNPVMAQGAYRRRPPGDVSYRILHSDALESRLPKLLPYQRSHDRGSPSVYPQFPVYTCRQSASAHGRGFWAFRADWRWVAGV
ncbi:hypothetical protein RRG08_004354 [Elysia crispata]|uniref:Uncharacterized protein n=1 Tax=Elysia crispata TaxID=231223 RepID=A0AAE0Z713_9GAST|nr:hypothetical protein RRG08_004354 [Elysia crispata]